VRIRQSRTIDGTIKGATFTCDATGKWYVTLVVEFARADCPPPQVTLDDVLGVDVGLASFATLSDGTVIENPRFFRRGRRKLRRAQRMLSRRKNGSKRREKAKGRVANVHQKIAAKRHDFCHQLSHLLTTRYTAIVLETLTISGLAKTKLATSVLDAAWAELFRQMTYKGRWRNQHVVFVGRFYPSSQLCWVCNYQQKDLALADREWDCPHCGTHHLRDHTAAQNLKREGFRLLVVAGHAKT
jgi:putative transposase